MLGEEINKIMARYYSLEILRKRKEKTARTQWGSI
jgi:hypothetical protein